MPRLNFVKAAQKTIYQNGKRVTYISKKGKKEGSELSKIDKTIPSGKDDKVVIAKGESYYWWQFKNGPKNYSKERPRNSQLTQSSYMSQLYDIQDKISEASCSDSDELVNLVDEVKQDLENLKDETQGSLDNMPESLQSSPTGELLQERIDSLDNAISEIEGLDLDYEEPTYEEWLEDEGIDEDDVDFDGEKEENPDFITWKENHMDEWVNEKLGEFQDISIE